MGHSHTRNKGRKGVIPRKAAKITSDSFMIDKRSSLETNRHDAAGLRKPAKYYGNDNAKASSSGRRSEQFTSPNKVRSVMRSDIEGKANLYIHIFTY